MLAKSLDGHPACPLLLFMRVIWAQYPSSDYFVTTLYEGYCDRKVVALNFIHTLEL